MNKWENRFLYLTAILLGSIVIIKAASCSMTWDESWTYIHYTRRWADLLTLDYANNHLFNSLLIRLSLLFTGTNSEIVIRLPNILAAIAYLAACLSMLPFVRYRKTFFIFQVGMPFLIDYFSLARGYGLAAGLIELALVIGFFRPVKNGSFILFGLCLGAANLTSFPLAIASLIFCAIFVILRVKKVPFALINSCKNFIFWSVIIELILTAIIALLCLEHVSHSDAGVFGSYDGWYKAIPQNIILQNFGAWEAYWLTPYILIGCALFFISQIRNLSMRSLILISVGLFSIGSICILSFIFHKPIPTARVLIPWYPFWILGFLSLLEDVPIHSKFFKPFYIQAVSCVICCCIALSFIHHLNFHKFEDYSNEDHIQSELAHAMSSPNHCLKPSIAAPPHDYYLLRWFGTFTPESFPRCRQ